MAPIYEPRTFTKEYDYGDGEGLRQEKYIDYPVRLGFEIVNENGEVQQTVTFPAEYEGVNSEPVLEIYGNKRYLRFYVGDGGYLYYPIKKGTNSIQSPKIIKSSAKVHPTKVNCSEIVNVTFDHLLDRNCGIEVVSLNGSVVFRTVAQAGSESARIYTSRFAPGIYVVNIHDGKDIKENCKIIVR